MPLSRRAVPAALIGLCLGLYFVSPHRRDLWVPDEPRYAAIVAGMVASGDWLLPRLNGELYTDKPPLYFWILALLRGVWGHSPTWLLTLPAAVTATATVLVVESAGRRWFGARAGVWAALLLATSGLWLGLAQAVRMDIPFTLAVTLALVAFVDFWMARAEHPALRLTLWFWVSLALATLTKGPVGLLVPLLIVAAFLLASRGGIPVAALRPAAGLALTLGIVLLWLGPALIAGGKPYAEAIFLKQTLRRAVSSWSHRQPVWFYLERLPLVWFPWLPLLLAALFDRGPEPERAQTARRFLLCWLLVWLGFFSLVSGKLEVYLLPMFPAMALLAGAFAADALGLTPLAEGAAAPVDGASRRRRLYAVAMAGTHASLLLAAFLLLGADLGDATYLRGSPAPALFLGAGVLGLLALALGRRALSLGVAAGFVVVVLGYATVELVPLVDHLLSGRSLARRVLEIGGGEAHAALYRIERPELVWWLGTRLPTVPDAAAVTTFLLSSPLAVCVARKSDFDQLRERDHLAVARDAELHLGNDRLILFRLAGAR